MVLSIYERLAAQAIGTEIVKYLSRKDAPEELAALTESRAVQALNEIVRALDNPALSDPDCFRQIEAVLSALEANGITSARHDW